MDEKQYEIQGVKLTMGVMTLGQDKKLVRLLKGKKIEFDKMTGGIQSILDYLIENDLVESFFETIMKGDVDAIVMDDLTNPELMEICTDFFGLNGGWIMKLTTFFSNFLSGNLQMIPSPNSTEKKTPTQGDSTTE